MKKTTALLALTISAGLAVAGAAYAQQKTMSIGTGGTGGVYYPLGVAIGKIYSEKIPNVKTQVQATKASVENLNLVQQGRGEIARQRRQHPPHGMCKVGPLDDQRFLDHQRRCLLIVIA